MISKTNNIAVLIKITTKLILFIVSLVQKARICCEIITTTKGKKIDGKKNLEKSIVLGGFQNVLQDFMAIVQSEIYHRDFLAGRKNHARLAFRWLHVG